MLPVKQWHLQCQRLSAHIHLNRGPLLTGNLHHHRITKILYNNKNINAVRNITLCRAVFFYFKLSFKWVSIYNVDFSCITQYLHHETCLYFKIKRNERVKNTSVSKLFNILQCEEQISPVKVRRASSQEDQVEPAHEETVTLVFIKLT